MLLPRLNNVTLLGVDCVDAERLAKVMSICLSYFEFPAAKLLTSIPMKDIPAGIERIGIAPINSLKEYSHFMMKNLNDYIETDFVLVVQHDGFILNPKAWTEEFLEYDYIGAPWWYKDECNVGNGGFSLRSKKLQAMLQSDPIIFETYCEDHNICRTYGNYLKSKGIKFAPEDLASQFSIEGDLHGTGKEKYSGDVWTGEFGFHGLDKTDISKWDGYKSFCIKPTD